MSDTELMFIHSCGKVMPRRIKIKFCSSFLMIATNWNYNRMIVVGEKSFGREMH